MAFRRFVLLRIERKIFIYAAFFVIAVGTTSAQPAEEQNMPCLSGLNCTVSGQDAARIKADVDSVVGSALNDAPVVDSHEPVLSAIVGVSWHGRRTYFGYGKNTAAYKPDTIVEIGSITKVFTTALLAEAVQNGSAHLDEKLSAYKDAIGLSSLTTCAENVTLEELANFSSGMPRLPDDLPKNHSIEYYKSVDFKSWVSGWVPEGTSSNDCKLPRPYAYSNASIGLLGYLVSHQLHDSYDRLISSHITTPLQMHSTFLPDPDGSIPAALAPRVAVGRSGRYEPVSAWPYYAWFAAGALRSDAEDMLSFGEAALGHQAIDSSVPSPENQGRIASLESALKMSETNFYPVTNSDGGLSFNQGLAWVQKPRDPSRNFAPLYLKDGQTNGFSSIIVVNHSKDLAVFIAFGKTKVSIDALGIRLARVIR